MIVTSGETTVVQAPVNGSQTPFTRAVASRSMTPEPAATPEAASFPSAVVIATEPLA